MEKLAKLKLAHVRGSVTAGNLQQMLYGGAVMLVSGEDFAPTQSEVSWPALPDMPSVARVLKLVVLPDCGDSSASRAMLV